MLPYGIIGNCKTCALIKKDAAVEWMCFPTFSSPSIFARILDKEKGGSLEIKPKGRYKISSRYIPYTAVLETLFESKQASFKVVDFFPRYRKLLSHKQARLVKQNRLVRMLIPLRGTPELKIIYNPKPNYASESCAFEEGAGNLLCKTALVELSLISNIPYASILDQECLELKQTKYLIIGSKENALDFSVKKCYTLLNATKRYWETFVSTLILPEHNKETIIRSAITLKLLTYSETGAIIAAPTTSIPEQIGTARTFDYRYCWIRDAVFCADALKKIGRDHESQRLLRFIINLVLKNDFIQIMYGLDGETKLQERELVHLAGFQHSGPVRIGNAAYKQVQHDIYGEILDLLYLYFVYYELEKKMTNKYWRFICYVVNQIKFNWGRKDSGIWEFREKDRHYTYSKFMCCIGLDRAIKLAQHFRKESNLKEWIELQEIIKEDILRNGYNDEINAFVMYYGGKELDASLLHMAYYEFLEPADPRLRQTVMAIYHTLRKGCLVQRYQAEDDFGKSSSAFTICSFWLIDALCYISEVKKARIIYNQMINLSNHLGLFSEDIDLATKKQLGNFPQSYTHVALINSSLLLSEWSARRKKLESIATKRKFM